MTRVGTALRSGFTELRRTPVLVALLVGGPAYVIYVFTSVAPEGPAVVHLGDEAVDTTLQAAFPAFTTPMTAALLAGIAGLFLVQSTATADARLVVAGYRSVEVVLARLCLLMGVAAIATGVSVGAMLTAFEPQALGWFTIATGLTALLYGILGLIVGALVDRLVGVYIIMFGSMIDLFIFQNPLASDRAAMAAFLPGHYPLKLAMEAGFTGQIAIADLAWTLVYLAVLLSLATLGFYRGTQVG